MLLILDKCVTIDYADPSRFAKIEQNKSKLK